MDATVTIEAREDAYSRPLDSIDVSIPELYQEDVYQPYFERLRREDPVHYCADSKFGPYWSVTRYKDIMKGRGQPPGILVEMGTRRRQARGPGAGL
jgi:hypothetical protein